MKHRLTLSLPIVAFALHARDAVGAGHHLTVAIEPRFAGAALIFDTMTNTTAAGQFVSVTRLDFLLSNIALRRADGAWLGQTNWFAYLSPREGRTSFELNSLPAGGYDRVRFQVGVPPALNHADPAQFAATHPLNPNVNGLHWNWQGGYVFGALEGAWLTETGKSSGYSYHLATDELLMTVELPVSFKLSGNRELRLALNVDRILGEPVPVVFSEATATTHSRSGDPLAAQLSRKMERAFSVVGAPAAAAAALPSGVVPTHRAIIAPNATPYRLTFPRFLPPPELPLDNPLTEEGVELGRRLFYDPGISINDRQSCASCHQAEAGFVDAGRRFSLGAEGQIGARNAMPLFNLAWKRAFFWDGRAPSLRQQVLMPIEDPGEMHENLTNVVAKLRVRADDYPSAFARAFGTPEISPDRLARALEQFLLVQVSHHSRFDRFARGGAPLTEEEQRGFQLFHTEYDPRRGQFGADCFHCHGGPLFQNVAFANNGLDAVPADLGRFLVTKRHGDRGKFAVPSLRNVARTAPYMHDGRFATLEEVVEHYRGGVQRGPTLDPNLAKHPTGRMLFSDEDKRALVAFLKTLTDDGPRE